MKRGEILLRRLSGLLISIVMAIGMLTTAVFAAGNATITITKPDSFKVDWETMTVNAYKVLNVKNPDDPIEQWIYEVDSNFKDFFNIDTNSSNNTVEDAFGGATVYLTYEDNHLQASNTEPKNEKYITLIGDNSKKLDTTYGEADLVSRLMGDSDGAGTSQNALLYTWIEKYIESTNIALAKTVTAGKSSSSMVLGELNEGYYALIFSNVPSGLSVKQGILISTRGTSAQMNLKAEEIPFTKHVADTPNQNISTGWGENASAAVGDTLSYKIDTYVPTLTDYDNLESFVVSDTLNNQKLNIGSIKIKIGDAEATSDTGENNTTIFKINDTKIATLTDSNAYDDESNRGSFTLTFVPSTLETYEGEEILVTYTAELTADAAKINGNTATLAYTNNGDNGQLTDKTEVYTYGIKVLKKFSDGNTKADNYSKVKFQLYNADGSSMLNLTGQNGIYKLADSNTDNRVQTLDLATDGSLTITGLDDDVNYVLKETNTASGFNTVGDITIDLAAINGKEKLLDLSSSITIGSTSAAITRLNNGDTSTDNASIAIVQFEVLNQKGFNLPQTGGAGTWMLTIGGVVLIAAAGILYFASKNKADA